VVVIHINTLNFRVQHVVGYRHVTGGTSASGLFLVKRLFFGIFNGLLCISHGAAEALSDGFLGFAPFDIGEIGTCLHYRLSINPPEDNVPEESPVAVGDGVVVCVCHIL